MAAAATDRLDPQHKVILTVLVIATFVVFLNETVLGVALPQIMAQLQIPASTGQWLSTAFMLTNAVVIPVTGFLLRRFGTRANYLGAMALFSAGTLLAALAPDFPVLLMARILQACGTAIMMPLLMTTLMMLVPAHLRGGVMGTITIVMSAAPALGPPVSGLVLSVAGWRWLFWLVLPIALLALLIGGQRITNAEEPQRLSLDVLSLFLAAPGFSGLVYGLSAFGQEAQGTVPLSSWYPVALGALLLGGFVLRQRRLERTDSALLDLRTFQHHAFTMAIVLMGLMMMSMFGSIILLPIYMQGVLGLSPLQSGLYMLPGGLIMGFSGPRVGKLYDRYGARKLVIPGAVVASAGFWVMATFGTATPPYLVMVAHVILLLGLSFLFTPLFTQAMAAVPPHLYAHASATLGTVQQIAGAAGTALFVTLYTRDLVAADHAGLTGPAAMVGGIHLAFLVAAGLSLLVIGLTMRVRPPAPQAAAAFDPVGV
jgi:DHA2 family lincomycin resistance protein-like MFS transporter